MRIIIIININMIIYTYIIIIVINLLLLLLSSVYLGIIAQVCNLLTCMDGPQDIKGAKA